MSLAYSSLLIDDFGEQCGVLEKAWVYFGFGEI